VRRVKEIPLGHLVAIAGTNETLLGIVVEAPAEFKGVNLVLGLAVEVSGTVKKPCLLPDSGVEQCFDFGGPATFLWPPAIARISPRWHAGLRPGHLAVTENVVAINGCYGRQQSKQAYWDVLTGRIVWDKYTMFLTEWQAGIPGPGGSLHPLMNFPADFIVATSHAPANESRAPRMVNSV
jgi:hypothetical protein